MTSGAGARDTIERVFRAEHGRVAASLIGAFRDFDVAEEAIQDAFTVALERFLRPPEYWCQIRARSSALARHSCAFDTAGTIRHEHC